MIFQQWVLYFCPFGVHCTTNLSISLYKHFIVSIHHDLLGILHINQCERVFVRMNPFEPSLFVFSLSMSLTFNAFYNSDDDDNDADDDNKD